MDDYQPPSEQRERMRSGVRARVGRMTQADGRLRRWSPPALLAVLCASALSPVLAIPAGATGLALAGIGVAGSVGANVLTDVISAAIGRLRTGGREPTEVEIETELEQRIHAALEVGGQQTDELRRDIAGLVQQIGLASVAVQEAVRSGDRELQTQLTDALAQLGGDFSEFRFLLAELETMLEAIQQQQDQQGSEHRLIVGLLRSQATHTRLLRQTVSTIERRTRKEGYDGSDRGQRSARWLEGPPYRGLAPFQEDHVEIFYGREQVVADLVSRLAERLTGLGLIVVTGASGSGKSSLLRAGLLPMLTRGSLSASSARWPRILMTPTRTPLLELSTHMAAMASVDPATVLDSLAENPEQAHLLVRQAVIADAARHEVSAESAAGHRLVLVIDQYEEIFMHDQRPNPDVEGMERQRHAFITALCAAASTQLGSYQNPPALVVIAVRGDFLERCAAYPLLLAAPSEGPFVVGPMGESDLRRVITGPAAAAGLQLEPGLADTILADLRSATAEGGYEAGALPWLSQAMLLTWEHREGNQLTSRGYGLAGGVRTAIQTSAETAYNGLSEPQKLFAASVFRALTAVARDGQLIRRRRSRADLYPGQTSAEWVNAEAVLEAFATKRLLVLSEGTAEIAHDELLRAWPRLRNWLEPDLASHLLYSQLLDDASEWARPHSNKDPAFLYRGTQLAAIRQATTQWEADPDRYPLTGTPGEFLAASERAAQSNIRRRRAVLSMLTISLVAAIIAAAAAISFADDADHQRILAESRQLAAQSELLRQIDPVNAALLAAAAWRTAPTTQARHSLLTTLQYPYRGSLVGHTGIVTAMAFSPNGRMFVTASAAGSPSALPDVATQLWDLATHREIGSPLTGHTNYVLDVAFSPDGRRLATASADRTVRLWNVITHRQIGPALRVPAAAGHSGVFNAVAFSPDGRTLATGGADKAVRLWDVATHQQIRPPLTGHTGEVNTVMFSPRGRILASGSMDGSVRLWSVVSHRQIGTALTGHNHQINGVEFSADGRTLATAGSDNTVRLWSVASHKQTGPSFAGIRAAFSPDGRTLATSNADGSVRMWDITTHRQIGTPIDHAGGEIAFSPDGQTVATINSAKYNEVRLWNVAAYRPISPLMMDSSTIQGLAFSPDGESLTAYGRDSSIRSWSVATHRQSGAHMAGLVFSGEKAVFSPDRRMLAIGGAYDNIKLLNVDSGRIIATFNPNVGYLYTMAFDPTRRILAAAGGDGIIRLWDLVTRRQIGPPFTGHTGQILTVAFSPDGRTLATGSSDNTVRLWDVMTHEQIGSAITGHEDNVLDVAFSPDGRFLATSGGNGWQLDAATDDSVRLWDVASHREIGSPMTGHTAAVGVVTFSPDGRTLASASYDKTVRLWDVATQQQIGPALATNEDWFASLTGSLVFSPNSRILATSFGKIVSLWDVSIPSNPLSSVCAIAGRSLTHAEWDQYVPGIKFQQVC